MYNFYLLIYNTIKLLYQRIGGNVVRMTGLFSYIDLNSLLTIFDIQIAIAIVVVTFILKGVIARIIIRIAYSITKKEGRDPKKSEMYSVVKGMVLITGIYLASLVIPKGERIAFVINEIYKYIVMLFITKGITALVNKDSKYFKKFSKSENDALNNFISKLIKVIIWVIAIFIIFMKIGIDLSGLITGLGIGSAVIALAAQELVKNLISGASILTDKPFVIGDWIEVGTFAGTVEDITWRSTRIRTINNTLVTIPNSIITSDYVINWNKLKSRRLDLELNLELNTTSEKIKKVLKEIKLVLATNPHVIEDTIQVNFAQIGNCSNNIKMYMYINEIDYKKFLNIKEEILCSLLLLVEKENIALAYPTQRVYVKNQEGEKTE